MSNNKDIRCFAYWTQTPEGISYRSGTLLVGRGNEQPIGNCVMKNAGSARPINSVPRKDGRLEFSVDATMYAVAELFEIDKRGGTVVIHNLSNVREADYSKAKGLFEKFDDVKPSWMDKSLPTYIGWGDAWKNPLFTERAKDFFTRAQVLNDSLKPNIEDNPFFHPLYLMRYGRNNPECLEQVRAFRQVLYKNINLTANVSQLNLGL